MRVHILIEIELTKKEMDTAHIRGVESLKDILMDEPIILSNSHIGLKGVVFDIAAMVDKDVH